ncbi:putative membrane protein [Puccinia sorghi]|uniref:Putative membrane protein n=1 Tax=Puccinia sorghi TaxID=27349 RepID=A0A0L6U6X8_9BASI|nr:putative membrane protein [Puccinia sorghi]
MWVAGPYLITGIVAVAYTRAVPTFNGYMDKRQL